MTVLMGGVSKIVAEKYRLVTNRTSGANDKNNDVSIYNNDAARCTLNTIQGLSIDDSSPISPAHKFDLYGWKLDLRLTNDDIYI